MLQLFFLSLCGVQRLAQRTEIIRAKEIALAIKFMKIQLNGPTIAFDTIKQLLREF